MIIVFLDSTNKVVATHYKPQLLSEDRLKEGVLVNSIPEPKQIDGKLAVLYCNSDTKELWYEYEDIPKTEGDILKEKLKTLEDENLVIKQSMAELAELMLGGM